MRRARVVALAAFVAYGAPAAAQPDFHRAEQDREITYWLLAPESGQFRISHDFTVRRAGQRSVHSFVRKGSTVTQAMVVDLDTGQTLKTYNAAGKDVNARWAYSGRSERKVGSSPSGVRLSMVSAMKRVVRWRAR